MVQLGYLCAVHSGLKLHSGLKSGMMPACIHAHPCHPCLPPVALNHCIWRPLVHIAQDVVLAAASAPAGALALMYHTWTAAVTWRAGKGVRVTCLLFKSEGNAY
jgi:hypothetical protein